MSARLTLALTLWVAVGCKHAPETPPDLSMVVDAAGGSDLSGASDLASADQATASDLTVAIDSASTDDLATAADQATASPDDLVTVDAVTPADDLVGADVPPDTTAPHVVDVTSSTPNGTYGAGSTIVILVKLDEAIVVTGTPRLTLETGVGDMIIDFKGLAAPDTLEFDYVITAGGFSSADLDVQSASALTLNGGTIKDAAGNDAILTLPVGAVAGSLASNKDLVVDGVRPSIVTWGTAAANGTYHAGDTIPIVVTFSEIVNSVDATLTLALGGGPRAVPLASGSGTNVLTFNYVVQANDFTPDLDYASTAPIGGTVSDMAGNAFLQPQPAPGPCSASLGGTHNLAVAGALLLPEPIHSGATNWNEYYRTADDTTACAASDVGALGQPVCAHGGEARRVRTAQASCGGLDLTDSLGAFVWKCSIVDGKAQFATNGFAPGKGLKDLVGASAWKTMSVTLTGCGGGCPQGGTAVTWWTNPVSTISPASGSLFGACNIWVVDADRSTSGYFLSSEKQALVTLPGASLLASANSSAPVGGLQSFQWLEGTFSSAGHTNVSVSVGHSFARVHQSAMSGLSLLFGADEGQLDEVTIAGGGQLRLTSADHNQVSGVNVTGVLAGGSGVALVTSSGNELVDVRVSGTVVSAAPVGVGIQLSPGNRVQRFELANLLYGFGATAGNTIANGRVTNCVSLLDIVGDSSHTNFSQLVIAGSLQGATFKADTTVAGLTLVNSSGLIVGARSTLTSVATHNIGGDAINVPSATSGVTFSQLAVGMGAVRLRSNTKFVGNLLVTNTSQCVIESGGDGFGNGTCLNTAQSAATYTSGKSLDAAWVGKASGDATNPSDTGGTATYSDALDWLSFVNDTRAWGKDGSAFPNADHQGPCVSGTCRIWDWRLASANTIIRNTSGNGSSANTAFVANAACPVEVDGNRTVDSAVYTYDAAFTAGLNGVEVPADGKGNDDGICETGEDCFERFLRSAIELPDSGSGDHDGLCEAGETCLYAPNFGAYQGHGVLQSCAFSASGGLTGITIVGRPNNGG